MRFPLAKNPEQKGPWTELKVHAGAVSIIATTLLWTDPNTTLVLGGVTMFLVYALLGFREAQKAPLWLTPLSFYFFWYCIGLGVSPLYVGLTTDLGETVRFASERSAVGLSDLAGGYVLFLVGAVVVHAGIQLLRPHETRRSHGNEKHLIGWLLVVWIIGLLFQLRPGYVSFLGGANRIFAVALVGATCAFAVTPRHRFGLSRLTFMLILVLATAGLFFGNLASGSKAYIMFSFLPIFWFFIIRPRLRIWMAPFALCLGLFYLGIVAPVVHTARQRPVLEGEDPRAHLVETFNKWSQEKQNPLNESFLAEQLDQFINRQFDAVPVGFFVGEVKHGGLLWGETMQYASYSFIPRIIWPDKPTVTRGGWFSTYLGLFQLESDATTAIGMTAVGELYWNFGTIGVVAGMFLIGLGQGLLWRTAGTDPREQPVHMLLYVSTVLGMSDMPEAVTVFVAIVLSFLTFKAAIVAFETVSHRKRSESMKPRFSIAR
ncbi:MAG TPA: hypothetical protein VJ023_16025 [Pyrinomonadaceae bacterium]|nr:hypothetical protein [Pyrinomonadaceae bacterium]